MMTVCHHEYRQNSSIVSDSDLVDSKGSHCKEITSLNSMAHIIINRNHISDGVAGGKRCIAQGGDEVAGRTELVDSGGLAGE